METPQLIGGFKQRFEQFVQRYKVLKFEHDKMAEEIKRLNETLENQKAENKELKNRLNKSELAKSFIASSGDTKEAKQKINKIVREIDNCIALLNR